MWICCWQWSMVPDLHCKHFAWQEQWKSCSQVLQVPRVWPYCQGLHQGRCLLCLQQGIALCQQTSRLVELKTDSVLSRKATWPKTARTRARRPATAAQVKIESNIDNNKQNIYILLRQRPHCHGLSQQPERLGQVTSPSSSIFIFALLSEWGKEMTRTRWKGWTWRIFKGTRWRFFNNFVIESRRLLCSLSYLILLLVKKFKVLLVDVVHIYLCCQLQLNLQFLCRDYKGSEWQASSTSRLCHR